MRCFTIAACGLSMVLLLLVAIPGAVAQETPTAQPFDAAKWNSLVAKKAALVKKLESLGGEYASAAPERQQQIADEAKKLQQDFQKNDAPQMLQLAPAAYAANPQDVNAAEIMLQVAYSKMQYDEAAKIAEGILAQQPDHSLALNVGGISNFAIHNFEKAVSQFEAAQKSGQLIPQLGGQYIETARNYIPYWEREQQLRKQEAAATGDQQLPRVKMTTAKGDIILELFENEAPNTVANFISLVEQGFYDGLKFHRVIPTFMAQGGCPNTREGAVGQPGTGGPVYNIECEAYEPNARRHFGGSLSMAHAGKDTGGSQFFITHLPTPHLDQEVSPQSVHTVFGRVIDGMDVVWSIKPDDAITKVEVIRKRDHEYKPETQPSQG